MRNALRALVATAVLSVVAAGFAVAHPPIDIVASNWKFTPAAITVHTGETQVLRMTSDEGVHGIQSDELGIAQTTVMPDKFVEASFTPKKAGTYVVHCSIVCGAGHPDMALKVNVVDR